MNSASGQETLASTSEGPGTRGLRLRGTSPFLTTRPLLPAAHSYARIPYSLRGPSLSHSVCKHTQLRMILCGQASLLHFPTVPRRRQAALFSELPRRVLLENSSE